MSKWAYILVGAVVLGVGGFAFFYVSTGLPSSDEDAALRESGACQAKCRDQYGGSGSAGFDACIRGCGEGGVLREECPPDRPACPAGESSVCRRGVWYCLDASRVFPETNNPTPTASPAPAPTPTPTGAPTPGSTQQPPAPPPPPAPSPTPPPPAPAPAPEPTPPPPPPAPTTANVTIEHFTFTPSTLTISAGDTVVFTNKDAVGHTATKIGSFNSGIITEGQSKSIVFAQKGTFDYFCDPHPYMRGTIIVE
ncbi:cupredoxin family copper-binding protein [Candidatus Kaiserbacteria bacterium]|nr:cupredoxin family copper-binding protein [Candidatus Kaiserbacteria bacterium]